MYKLPKASAPLTYRIIWTQLCIDETHTIKRKVFYNKRESDKSIFPCVSWGKSGAWQCFWARALFCTPLFHRRSTPALSSQRHHRHLFIFLRNSSDTFMDWTISGWKRSSFYSFLFILFTASLPELVLVFYCCNWFWDLPPYFPAILLILQNANL